MMKKTYSLMVPMRDGVRLSTDVYLPENAVGKMPAVFVRLPYRKDLYFQGINGATAEAIYNKGYAFVIQDCRGSGDSEGYYKPWTHDAEDGYDTIEWMAEQDWCTGKVGMYGASNLGSVQLLAASECPPHLTTIVPMGTSDAMPFFENGILNQAAVTIWYTQQAMNFSTREGVEESKKKRLIKDFEKILSNMEEQFMFTPMKDAPFCNVEGVDMERFYQEYLEYMDTPSHWMDLKSPCTIVNIDIPIMFLTNWYDHLAHNIFRMYKTIKDHGTPRAQKELRLYIGPWREYPGIEGTDKGLWGNDIPLAEILIDWFDYWLKGQDNCIATNPLVYLHTMGKVVWRYENSWPLPKTSFTKYYLSSKNGANSINGDGCLKTKQPFSEKAYDEYIYDPAKPVPTRSGIVINPSDKLLQNQIDVEMREDVLVYTTDLLEEDTEITGPIMAHIWASSSTVDTDFTARLTDVHPDGTSYNVCEGIIRAKFRNGVDKCELIIPGAVYDYRIDMSSTGMVFKKGHSIRLQIASSNFPKHDRNMNTGHKVGVDTAGIIATQRIFHDLEHPSYLLLPVIKES